MLISMLIGRRAAMHRISALSTAPTFADACRETIDACTNEAFRSLSPKFLFVTIQPHSLAFRPNVAFIFFSDLYLAEEGEEECLEALRSMIKGRLPPSISIVGCTGIFSEMIFISICLHVMNVRCAGLGIVGHNPRTSKPMEVSFLVYAATFYF
jgi:hypothetical protein